MDSIANAKQGNLPKFNFYEDLILKVDVTFWMSKTEIDHRTVQCHREDVKLDLAPYVAHIHDWDLHHRQQRQMPDGKARRKESGVGKLGLGETWVR